MGIYESGENYLETILLLERRNGTVRSIDIANELDYSKPSISRAMSILKESGYIWMEKNGDIHLTEKGRARANSIYERHRLITEYLMRALGVDRETAEEDACRIEHVISETSFEKIKDKIKELDEN
ncbi:MAG TPA: metal-dependent transcriptional regulator [Bacillota bacterium]|jgi:DtxR family Mn-dependent transcriptional regulator|nr:metal-dependent transcriptional regulator [Bacillota bacterium]HPZ59270.1 metal-dependent transcriptional regulator [Bacillota bacterium]HQC82953.1 metal-dependent transcriptional regulator [Bacillota bacterium]